MEVQSYLGLFYAIRFWSGVAMVLGLLFFLADLFALRPLPEPRIVMEEEQVLAFKA